MHIKQILRYQFVYVLLVILLVAAVIFNINTGNINISPARIFRIIFLKDYVGTPEYNIIWKIRLPRLCMAAILGGIGVITCPRSTVIVGIFITDIF